MEMVRTGTSSHMSCSQIRETPQASAGFTPFKLLFGRRPQGLLDVDVQLLPIRTTSEQVREMQECIEKVAPIMCHHMLTVQAEQTRLYNRSAQPQEFQPGDCLLFLVPSTNNKVPGAVAESVHYGQACGASELPPATAR